MSRWAVIAIAFVLAALPLAAGTVPPRPYIFTTQDHSLRGTADDCGHFHAVTQSTFPSTRHAEENRDVTLAGIDLLKVRTSDDGGISVRGWDKPVAKLTVCKSAVALTDAQAQKVLGEVSVSVRNGEIVAQGPERNETQAWWVHMILRVPRRTSVDVASGNGGISIRDLAGRLLAHARNGGISLDGYGGWATVTTENGGITLDRISGHLDASTSNGPILLRTGAATPSVEAKTDDEGEIVCSLRGCADGAGHWSASRKQLRVGEKAPAIHLTTTKAAIVIR